MKGCKKKITLDSSYLIWFFSNARITLLLSQPWLDQPFEDLEPLQLWFASQMKLGVLIEAMPPAWGQNSNISTHRIKGMAAHMQETKWCHIVSLGQFLSWLSQWNPSTCAINTYIVLFWREPSPRQSYQSLELDLLWAFARMIVMLPAVWQSSLLTLCMQRIDQINDLSIQQKLTQIYLIDPLHHILVLNRKWYSQLNLKAKDTG